MALEKIRDKYELADLINEFLSKSRPVGRSDLLVGRDRELEKVEQALLSKGTQAFVVGDRGVGKTSVAIISAKNYQSEDNDFIQIDCSSSTTFESIVANIIYKTIKCSRIYDRKDVEKASLLLSLKGIFSAGFQKDSEVRLNDIEGEIRGITDAVRLFQWIAEYHSRAR